MSQKRDEMASEFVKKKSFSFHPDEKARHEDVYKVAWDAAVEHDERVKALVELAETVASPNLNAYKVHQDMAREALTNYRESVKG